MQVTITQLQNGTTADAAAVNTNLNTLAAAVNGGLQADNIQDGTITDAKLATSPTVTRRETIANYVVTGLTIGTSSGLSTSVAGGKAYVNGKPVSINSTPVTVSASQDTYVDLLDDGSIVKVPVGNNVLAGMAISTNTDGSQALRLGKLVSSGTAIVQVLQAGINTAPTAPNTLGWWGFDPLGNPVYPQSPSRRLVGRNGFYGNISIPNTSTAQGGISFYLSVAREVRLTWNVSELTMSASGFTAFEIWDSGHTTRYARAAVSYTGQNNSGTAVGYATFPAGYNTVNLYTATSTGTGTLVASTSSYSYVTAELT